MALTDGLISCFECEEASGDIIDAVGGTNTLTDTNTVTSAAGKVGNARQFTAANLEYGIKTSPTFPSGATQSCTTAAWLYLDSVTGARCALGKAAAAGDQRQWLGPYINGSTAQLYVSGNGTSFSVVSASSFGALSTATWYFVVCRYDHANSLIKISVNAGTVNTAAHSTGIFAGTDPLYLGRWASAAEVMDGRIDQALIYDRSISDAEITELYNSGNGLSYAAMAGASSIDLTIRDDIQHTIYKFF